MKQLFAFTVFIIVLLTGSPLFALDQGGESLEWLVTARPSIAIETVTALTPIEGATPTEYSIKIETNLKEALKGQPPQQANFVRRWQPGEKPGQSDSSNPANGTDYLLFFDGHGQVTNAFNLKYPSRRIGMGSISKDVAITNDFVILKSSDVILDTVRRRLDLLSEGPGVPTAVSTPPVSKSVDVPIQSQAWNVLCDGTICNLIIPDDSQNKNLKPLPALVIRQAQFSGPAFERECDQLPKKAFQIKSLASDQAQILSLGCTAYPHGTEPTQDVEKLTIVFQVNDIAKEADYDFQWDLDPDAPHGKQRGFFTGKELMCEDMARTLQFRAGGQVPLTSLPVSVAPVSNASAPAPTAVTPTPAVDNGPQLVATWKAECVPNDLWEYVVTLELNVRYAHPEAASSNPVPAANSPAIGQSKPAAPVSVTAPVPNLQLVPTAK